MRPPKMTNRKVLPQTDVSSQVINIKTQKQLKPIMNSSKLSVLNIAPGEIEKMEQELP